MPEGGNKSSLVPTIAARAVQAVRYVINGGDTTTWFSPGQPLKPLAPTDVAGRLWDYPVSYNIQITPRPFNAVSFKELRTIADNCDVLRLVIETCKDRVEAMQWGIKPIDPQDKTNYADKIADIKSFFAFPDKEHDWSQWVRMLMEEVAVIDALSIYKRRAKDGSLFALDIIDGSTIAVKIDAYGRRPVAPDPAYQQILHGVPAVDYPSTSLIYFPRNVRAQTPYGYSRTEQIVISAMTEIHRMRSQLEYFTEGSIPDAFGTVPTTWTSEQLDKAEIKLNTMLAGNTANRRRLKLMPDGFKYTETKQAPIKDEFDEWLARKICYAFNVSPQAFIKMGNRAESATAKDTEKEQGTATDANFIKRIMNRIIAEEFECPMLCFEWLDQTDQDAKEAADIDATMVKNAIMSINEVRTTRGLDPIDGGDEPMALTATGWIPLPGTALDLQMQEQRAALAPQLPANDDEEKLDNTDEKDKPAKKSLGKAVRHKAIPFLAAYSRTDSKKPHHDHSQCSH